MRAPGGGGRANAETLRPALQACSGRALSKGAAGMGGQRDEAALHGPL